MAFVLFSKDRVCIINDRLTRQIIGAPYYLTHFYLFSSGDVVSEEVSRETC